ncbi:MAG TPA: dTMP kinase [Patescibacteria group bacterium]|nr:dTMP kinase [Patescibacteria group bacterium]
MSEPLGKYIVIEGPEGAGKTTQITLLAAGLQAAGLPVRVLREPDSQSDLTARSIRQLTQDPRYPMNSRTEVLLYNAARSQSLDIIRASIAQGIMCLVDRNYLTTLAIQYYGRGDVPDYETINQIISFAVNGMEPDLTIVLDAPVQMLRERTQTRRTKERFDNLDEAFLERVRAGYLWEAKQRGLPVVFATEPPEEVFKQVWELVAQTLAIRGPKAQQASEPASIRDILAERQTTMPHSKQMETQGEDEALVIKDDQGVYSVTDAGRRELEQAVTNVDDDVYSFTERLSPMTIAAAMARLSRRGDDMRITLLDEFMGKAGKDEQLLHRIITAFGDDSVQQLAGQHIVVENASNLLTKKLEWGRLAAYLEQSTRYIYFDQKDKDGNYKYYVPKQFNKKTASLYRKAMDAIFDSYSDMVRELTTYIQQHSNVPKKEQDGAWRAATRAQACDAVRPVLPVATKSTVGIYASGQALESLIMHLLSDELPEARETGQKMLDEARKTMGTFLERADKPDRGGAMVAYRANTAAGVKDLAHKYLPDNYGQQDAPVTLTAVWPRNELDLIPDMLYDHSNLSLEELKQQVSAWPYSRKEKVFKAYVGERLNRRHKPGRALENAHYSWDLLCDYGIFRDLQRHRIVDDLEWQLLTPRYGYDVPSLIEEAGLTEQFQACFDTSLELYSALQASGYELEAQYATLLGHKMRWKITYNAREAFHLHELRTTPQGHPGYRKLVLQMHEKLAEIHPMLAEAMKFVNQDEDPALTRLAAERYTQFKLEQLDKAKSK